MFDLSTGAVAGGTAGTVLTAAAFAMKRGLGTLIVKRVDVTLDKLPTALDGTIMSCNKAARLSSGYDADELIGMNVAELAIEGFALRYDVSADVNETAAIVLDAGGGEGVGALFESREAGLAAGVTGGLLVLALLLWPLIPVELAPQSDADEIDVEIEILEGLEDRRIEAVDDGLPFLRGARGRQGQEVGQHEQRPSG